jgi:hypothetical protein
VVFCRLPPLWLLLVFGSGMCKIRGCGFVFRASLHGTMSDGCDLTLDDQSKPRHLYDIVLPRCIVVSQSTGWGCSGGRRVSMGTEHCMRKKEAGCDVRFRKGEEEMLERLERQSRYGNEEENSTTKKARA